MVYQLPVSSSPYRPSTSLLTPTTCGLLVSPESAGTITHLVVSAPTLEGSPKQLDSPPTNSNLEKLPSISTTMWWPLPQQKWFSRLSRRLCTWSRWSRLRSSLWADHNRTDLSGSSFVDTGQRLPPLVRAWQLAKYCHSKLLLLVPQNLSPLLLVPRTSQTWSATKEINLIIPIYSLITWHDNRDRCYKSAVTLAFHA